MYTECRKYLVETVAAVSGRQPLTSMKRLIAAADSRVAAVLCEEEALAKDKSKRIYTDPAGRHRRTKKYKREITFTVTIGDYNETEAEAVYNKLLEALADGIYIDGNWVEIEPSRADWAAGDDSILRAKCAVQMAVKFIGGVYTDTDFARVSDVSITAGKE